MTYHRDRTEGSGAISAFLPAHRSAPAPRIRARRPGRWHHSAALGAVRVDDEGPGPAGGGGGRPPVRRIAAGGGVMPVMPFQTGLVVRSTTPGLTPTLGTRTPTGILTAPPLTTIRMPLQIGSGIGQAVPVAVPTPLPPKPGRDGVRPVAAEPVMPAIDMLELEEAPTPGSASPAVSVNRLPLILAAAGIGLAWYLFRGKGRH